LVGFASIVSWRHEEVKHLFYIAGRIDPVPSHYAYVGTVFGYIEKHKVIGVKVEATEFELGDRIAFELPAEFVEQDVTSLQEDNKEIQRAAVNAKVGLTTELSKSQAREGVRVFRVARSPDTQGSTTPE